MSRLQRVASIAAPRRPEVGPGVLDLGDDHGRDLVEIVAVLGRRRCRVRFPSGAELIVPDRLLR